MLNTYEMKVLTIALIASLSMPSTTMATEKELVYVDHVSVEKIKGGGFKITASGTAPTPNWVVVLTPATYIQEPKDWVIEAAGIPPSGIVNQVVTPWEESIELSPGPKTTTVTVIGLNSSVSADVPHQ